MLTDHVKPAGWSPEYHIDRWTLNLYALRGDIFLGSEKKQITTGSAILMPPGTRRRFHFATRGEHRVAHFDCSHVPAEGDVVYIHQMPSAQAKRLAAVFDQAVRIGPGRQCDALIWTVLWEVCESQADTEDASLHPGVAQAVACVRTRLSETLCVHDLVAASGLSHNHLTRLFTSQLGMTPVAYLRAQRMSLAKELLEQTDLPMKQIAIDVGIPDPQWFNKTVRRTFGVSPTAIRAAR